MLKGFINFLDRLFGGPYGAVTRMGTFADAMAPYMTAMEFGHEDAREPMAFDEEEYAVDRIQCCLMRQCRFPGFTCPDCGRAVFKSNDIGTVSNPGEETELVGA